MTRIPYTSLTATRAQSNGTEWPMFLLVNPSVSSRTVIITDILSTFNANNIAVEGRVYLNPTITANGTVLSINSLHQINTVPSVCAAFYSPTIANNGTLLYLTSLFNSSSILEERIGLILDSGNTFLVTVKPFATGL